MRSRTKTHVLLSADDRTGALEIGGLVADETATIPVGPTVESERCCVVDIASRHLSKEDAQARMAELVARPADHRAHKMDAGLRGNWAYEIEVLLDAGYKVAVICAFPDAGRRCKNGVVYIHGKPVLESVFGNDPLNAPVSSKPAEVLEHSGVRGEWVVWDANDNREMQDNIRRAIAEDRIVIGASGAIGGFAREYLSARPPRTIALPKPTVVLCGSLNPLSREQIDAIGVTVQTTTSGVEFSDDVTVLATPIPEGGITDAEAVMMAKDAAAMLRDEWARIGTLVVIGGDTAAAIVGDDALDCMGTVAPGIPASTYEGLCLITKGGGIGELETVKTIVAATARP
jgi:uncharacterized protein YgbK (DUF1537 family)